jgi:uncharacterized membrane protein YfcA
MNRDIKQKVRDFIIFCPFLVLHEWGGVFGITSAVITTIIYGYLTNKPRVWLTTKIAIFQATLVVLYYMSKALPDWSILCNLLSILVFGAVLIASVGKKRVVNL